MKFLRDKAHCKHEAYSKGDFAVLTGTLTPDAPTQDITYPEGFTQSNCVVTSIMLKNEGTENWVNGSTYDMASNTASAIPVRAILSSDKIKLTVKSLFITEESFMLGTIVNNVNFKIVLMKIS